jgi:hypothetical protein
MTFFFLETDKQPKTVCHSPKRYVSVAEFILRIHHYGDSLPSERYKQYTVVVLNLKLQ